MAAFANSEGGRLFIGVADDGSLPGLVRKDVGRINQLVSNAASQLVRSPLAVQTENVALEGGRIVIVLTIPKGIDKPYFDKNGVIWLKCGADKRRINSKEELRRFFQISNQFHADELPTRADVDKLDKLRFRDFLKDVYKLEYPDSAEELIKLLQNMNLATDAGVLNLAGTLLFAERPEWIKPQFVVKAVRYPGNAIHVSEYIDTEDFSGPLQKIFDDALAFVMRNLHKIQAGQGVNAPGLPEIPEAVFEELLVNALVHRDYLVSAPIRLFIFDNRIEIISPGHLPNNLTVEKVKAGNSNIRNPVLVSYIAKGLLPYHGIGSGIKRALDEWPVIDFIDDQNGCVFKVVVRRKEADGRVFYQSSPTVSEEASVKTSEKTIFSPTVSEEVSVKTSGKTIFSPTVSEEVSVKTSGKTAFSPTVSEDASVKTSGKTIFSPTVSEDASVKTSGKIVQAVQRNSMITIPELAALVGVTERSIERNIKKLQKERKLRRVGPAKGGYWQLP